jgi:hypothetical protein
MKTIFAFILCFLGLQSDVEKANEDKIIKIRISTVYENIQTFIAIDCDRFETALSGDALETELTDDNKISDFMKRFESADTLTEPYLDVRQKILVYHKSGIVDTICRGLFSHVFYYNGKYYSEK